MSKILILGGYGYTGKLLAKYLLAQTDVEIIISGRNLERAKSFVGELNDSRVAVRLFKDMQRMGAEVIETQHNKKNSWPHHFRDNKLIFNQPIL